MCEVKIFYILINWNASSLETDRLLYQTTKAQSAALFVKSLTKWNTDITAYLLFHLLVTRTRSPCRGFHRTTWFSWTVSREWKMNLLLVPKGWLSTEGQMKVQQKEKTSMGPCVCACMLLFSSETVITWLSSLGIDIFFLYSPFHRWHHHFLSEHTRFSLWILCVRFARECTEHAHAHMHAHTIPVTFSRSTPSGCPVLTQVRTQYTFLDTWNLIRKRTKSSHPRVPMGF